MSPDYGFVALAALFGLLVGSFLNVVVYRLPLMMQAAWAREYAAWAAEQAGAQPNAQPHTPEATQRFNLLVPASHCPHCKHPISWLENIPVLSFLVLRARCSQCHTRISARYALVEMATAAIAAWCAWRYGIHWAALCWFGFAAALLCLALIDWDTTYLPDALTQPLLWAGLLAAALQITALPLQQALWGAVLGYLSLWSVYWAFKLATGKEGMGAGDFKLLAALGAWLGVQALLPMILLASIIGAAAGIALKLTGRLRQGIYVPFGPFLALGGFAAWLAGVPRLLALMGW